MAQSRGNFTCTACGQSFETKADLRDHEELRHSAGGSTKGSGEEPAHGGEGWRTEDRPERGA